MQRTVIVHTVCLTTLGLIPCLAEVHAQTATLYGIVDVGVERLNRAGPRGGSLTRVPSLTASVPSRWGVRVREDLGGGMGAIAVLEAGFAPDAGTLGQGGRAFGRQAFVGLEGRWGQLAMGRQYTLLGSALADADVLGPNIYGHASFDTYLPNARADNSIAYRGRFSGLSLGALYSFGRDAVNAGPGASGTNCAGEAVGDSRRCRALSAGVKYDSGGQWGAAFAMDRIHGGPGAFAGLDSSALTDTRTVLSGYLKLAGARIGAYMLRRTNDASAATPRSRLYHVGASYPVGQWTLDAGAFRYDLKNSANDATMLAARASYHLSKRTAVYVQAGRMSNKGLSAISTSVGGVAPPAGQSQTGVMTGLRHSF